MTREWLEAFGRYHASRLLGAWLRVTRDGGLPSAATIDVIAEHVTRSLLEGLRRETGPALPASLAPLLRAFIAGLLEDEATSRERDQRWAQPSVN